MVMGKEIEHTLTSLSVYEVICFLTRQAANIELYVGLCCFGILFLSCFLYFLCIDLLKFLGKRVDAHPGSADNAIVDILIGIRSLKAYKTL